MPGGSSGGSTGLHGLVVVEHAGSTAGAHAAKLLGDLGATVVCIEPPGGAPLRADAAAWAAFMSSKHVVDAGSDEAVNALGRADVVIRSSAQGVPEPTAAGGPRAIDVTITPFGTSGPYAHWRSCDIVDQAIGGHLYLSGRPDREPIIGPTGQAALAAGIWAAIGAMAAVRERERSGVVQHVDVTHHEALVAMHQFTDVRYTHAGNVLQRMGNRYAGPGSPIGMYRASDGWMAFTVATAAHGEMLLAMIDRMDLLELPGVQTVTDVMINPSILDPALNGWLATQTVADAVELLQSARLAVGPVLTMRQMLEDPQLAARRWWQSVDIDGRTVRLPGPPYRIGSATWGLDPKPLPPSAAEPSAPAASVERTPRRPLDGIRVLDLTRVWAGPLAARILSDLGAEVVMVEALNQRTPLNMPQAYVDASHFYPNDDAGDEPWNTHGFVNKFAVGKKSIGLDLNTAEGRATFEELVIRADVVIENFSPRVMPNLGLGEDRLHELNPSLIYLTMPGYGRTGPARDYSAYGPVLDSHAGLSTLMGYEGVDAWKCGIAWPDPVGGVHGALAVLAALHRRELDPQRRGTTVEVPQFETAITMIGDRVVRAQIDQADPPIIGNRHPVVAPQGVYATAGNDDWLALSVPDDETWHALCTAAALPGDWASWDLSTRRANHDDIDRAISTWSTTLDKHDATAQLQAAGVPASPVANARDLLHDPQLVHRSFFADVTHRLAGTHAWHGLACRLSATPSAIDGPAPCLGEHNREVLRTWAGLTDGEIDALEADGVLGSRPTE